MKVQFKYSIITGLYVRGITFAVVFILDAVFITLGSLGWLPFAAHVTALSLGGIGIAAMFAANILNDVIITRRMFAAPEAYLYALTPVPRWKTLLASVITMFVMDFVTMALVITGEVWLSFNFVGFDEIWSTVVWGIQQNPSYLIYVFWGILMLIAGYFLVMMIILFCVTAKGSIFYKMPASGLLAVLLACACFYAVSLLQLVLAPFGSIQRYSIFIVITLGSSTALPVLFLLTILEAAALFIVTSKLMERRMNI